MDPLVIGIIKVGGIILVVLVMIGMTAERMKGVRAYQELSNVAEKFEKLQRQIDDLKREVEEMKRK